MARDMVLGDDAVVYGFKGTSNDLFGDTFTEVAGWEHGTAGFAGNIYSKLASENGIQPVDPVLTAAREPYKMGRFLVKILKTVPWFDKKAKYAWRYIVEDTTTSVSGIQDYTFETFQRQHGVIRQNSTYGGMFKETNGEFTLKVPETAGQLVRKSIDYWLYGISDPKTGVATYYGKDVRDLQPNKSMTILYVLLGPTCRPHDIEYACIWHDAILTSPKHAHNNSEIGDAGQGTDHDLTFNGIFDRGPQVDLLASIIVDREGLYEERNYNSILPKYMYDNYMAPDRSDYNITIANRLATEAGLRTNFNSAEDSIAYNEADRSTIDTIRNAYSAYFQDSLGSDKMGLGGVNGTSHL
jgi:hypothetical protein